VCIRFASVLTATHSLRLPVCVLWLCLRVCSSQVLYRELGLSRVLRWVRLGLLDASEVITMKVRGCGAVMRCTPAVAKRWTSAHHTAGQHSGIVGAHICLRCCYTAASAGGGAGINAACCLLSARRTCETQGVHQRPSAGASSWLQM
jgi:hypothetical protein